MVKMTCDDGWAADCQHEDGLWVLPWSENMCICLHNQATGIRVHSPWQHSWCCRCASCISRALGMVHCVASQSKLQQMRIAPIARDVMPVVNAALEMPCRFLG